MSGPGSGSALLIVTAVAAEAEAITAARPGSRVVVGGVGAAASAAATAIALTREPADLVICMGIAGGFGLEPGALAVAGTAVFADLGAQTAGGEFLPLSTLGFGTDRYPAEPQLALELADRTGAHLGTILTVATVTGTAARAADWVRRYPDVVAEAMEGAGVAAAASALGVAWAEIRAVSNLVGPRDRESWQVPQALAALGRAAAALGSAPASATGTATEIG